MVAIFFGEGRPVILRHLYDAEPFQGAENGHGMCTREWTDGRGGPMVRVNMTRCIVDTERLERLLMTER